jgi:class 3 adenylate cyclase
MLEPALKNHHIELLALNFRPDEINEMGRLLFKKYDSHSLSGIETHFTLSPRKCASVLVDQCIEFDKVDKLIELVASLDEQTIMGRQIKVDGLEEFLKNLTQTGMVYDFQRRRLTKVRSDFGKLLNWGALKDGKRYVITVMSIDVVENSRLVREYGNRVMERLYLSLRKFLEKQIARYDGRIWNFAGDGGIAAFAFRMHPDRAVLCALEIQRTVPLFNLQSVIPAEEHFSLRIALDTGSIKFLSDTGSIVSETINYASHLEKQFTSPGSVTISGTLQNELNPRIAAVFECAGEFEGQTAYCTSNRLDTFY